ncbi:MAG: stage 0 sporulation family protein [Anaerolineae bacterium]|nr:stage 0 sporulation family protein [Anaerolineae bacterium]
MPTVVGVRFKPATKVYYFDPGDLLDLKEGEHVIVETARGREMGQVVLPPTEVPDEEVVGQLKKVLRRATAWDATQADHYRAREAKALERCREKVREHGLPMKVIAAEYSFDGSRLVFYFTAEKRVDFRALVRDLARTFKTRIELRQVGVRDEAKLRGGIGLCGRELCCRTWLSEFSPVSIRMAKQQDMPLNPADISGICGRLLCCLAYENDVYAEIKARLPKVKSIVETPHGPGKVVAVNALKETVSVQLESEAIMEVHASELLEPAKAEPPAASGERKRKRRRRAKGGKGDG